MESICGKLSNTNIIIVLHLINCESSFFHRVAGLIILCKKIASSDAMCHFSSLLHDMHLRKMLINQNVRNCPAVVCFLQLSEYSIFWRDATMESTCPNCGQALDARLDYCAICNGPEKAVPASASPTVPQLPPDANHAVCSLCKTQYHRDDMIDFGGYWVCAGCKPVYVSMIEQGTLRPGGHYAGFWIRVAAKVLDQIIVSVFTGLIMMVFLAGMVVVKDETMNIIISILLFLMIYAVQIAFVTFFVGKFQATPGKMACGIKVVSPEGGKITYLRAFGRYFGEMLSGLTFGIGYIIAGFDQEKRALHDYVCTTRVVYK